MQFNVYVQGKFHKLMTARNAGEALVMVARDVKSGAVAGFNPAKDHDIKIVAK